MARVRRLSGTVDDILPVLRDCRVEEVVVVGFISIDHQMRKCCTADVRPYEAEIRSGGWMLKIRMREGLFHR